MGIKPSEYQIQIFKDANKTKHNMGVTALAGAGKTTTLVNLIKFLEELKDKKSRIVFIAFNKSIVEEIKSKISTIDSIGENVEVSTVHALGYKSVQHRCKIVNNVFPEVNQKKPWLTAMKLSEEQIWDIRPKNKFNHYLYVLTELVSLYQLCMLETVSELKEMAPYYDIDTSISSTIKENPDLIFQRAISVAERMKNDITSVNYDEMIYYPASDPDFYVKKADVVIVDEAQDLNKVQQEFVSKMLKTNGRVIFVGDPHQSIYGFAKADIHSFPNMMTKFNAKEYMLPISYRCPKKIIELAQKIVPEIKAHKEDVGIVQRGSINDLRSGDIVLCRNVKPLIKLFFELMDREVKCQLKGENIHVQLIRFTERFNRMKSERMIEELHKELNRMFYDLQDQGISNPRNHVKYEKFLEKIEILEIFKDKYPTVKSIRTKLDDMFSDKNNSGIILSTGHKSKGLEYDRVHIIRLDAIYPISDKIKDWQIEQELNLLYVMITRSKKELYFITDWVDNNKWINSNLKSINKLLNESNI